MGEDSKVFEGKLYFHDGTSWQSIDPCYEPTSIAMLPDYFSFVVQTPHFRTNKRFKKFLMGIGVSRNLADFMCKMIAKGKGKYQLSYSGYMLAVIDNLTVLKDWAVIVDEKELEIINKMIEKENQNA